MLTMEDAILAAGTSGGREVVFLGYFSFKRLQTRSQKEIWKRTGKKITVNERRNCSFLRELQIKAEGAAGGHCGNAAEPQLRWPQSALSLGFFTGVLSFVMLIPPGNFKSNICRENVKDLAKQER